MVVRSVKNPTANIIPAVARPALSFNTWYGAGFPSIISHGIISQNSFLNIISLWNDNTSVYCMKNAEKSMSYLLNYLNFEILLYNGFNFYFQ